MWSRADERSAGGSPAGTPPARRRLSFPIVGAVLGAVVVFALAPHCIGWFSVPTGGIGAVTVAKYPKGFDYFVIIALTIASAVGAFLLSQQAPADGARTAKRSATLITTIVVFVAMF